ncbi:CIA30 family protein [Shewanella sp. VB17]|uniref:CIA30 family protein n=1 Tax=Shewanella sp. VB17 TaxID=2739432 RepID=UPI001563B214|nr:CIA30 family protein [Shewanella sp. VB17]NRD72662.1 CIA30 family protein [Shewanella sp. VB17]
MLDFTQQNEITYWRMTDDAVMGGKSKGNISFDQGHGLFVGHISLENNGGFSSVSRSIAPLLKDVETVTVDIKGDGHTYQLRMMVNLDGYRLAYKHEFDTVIDHREKLIFTLADFQACFRGRLIPNAPLLKSDDILEIGFLITKKQAGKFCLSIFSVLFGKHQHGSLPSY